MENQTLFQALPSSSSGAADVQGSSKALPSNLHVRTANLLTLCHSLTYAAHKPHTHTHCVYVLCKSAQDIDTDTCTKLTLRKKSTKLTLSKKPISVLPFLYPWVFISQLRVLSFSSAHSHFLLFSSSEKYSMFLQTVKIHLYNKPTEGFQNTTSSQMKPWRMW